MVPKDCNTYFPSRGMAGQALMGEVASAEACPAGSFSTADRHATAQDTDSRGT